MRPSLALPPTKNTDRRTHPREPACVASCTGGKRACVSEYPEEFYEALHQGTPGDLAYYQSQCPETSSILELGCGNGRVLEALATPSRHCVGVDIHHGLLSLAESRLKNAPNTALLAQDMLDLSLNQSFDRILLPFCGIYCVESGEDLDRLFAGVKAHLAPKGQFILDTYNAETFHQDQDEPDDEQVPHDHGSINVRDVEFQVFEQSRWDRSRQTILVSYLHAALDADAAAAAGLADEVVAELAHHYWLTEQLKTSAARAGLALRNAFADFHQSPWDPEAPWNVFHFAHA